MFGMCAVMYGRRLFSSVFAITEKRAMGPYEVSLSMSLLGFGMRTMFANFHMCGIMLVLRAVQHARGECESKRAYVIWVPDV